MLLALSGQVFLDGTIVMIPAFQTSGPKFASGICWVSYKPLVFFLSCATFFAFVHLLTLGLELTIKQFLTLWDLAVLYNLPQIVFHSLYCNS